MNISLFLIFLYLNDDIISTAIIDIMIVIMKGFVICANSSTASVNEDTGIGNPINVFVGPSWYVIIVLYLLNLSIPQHIVSIAGIYMIGVLYEKIKTNAGDTPNDTISAKESIVSPNTSSVCDGYLRAIGPSIASKSTAIMSNTADRYN